MHKNLLLIPGIVFFLINSCTTVKDPVPVPQVVGNPLMSEKLPVVESVSGAANWSDIENIVMENPVMEEPVIDVISVDFLFTGGKKITRERSLLPLPQLVLPSMKPAATPVPHGKKTIPAAPRRTAGKTQAKTPAGNVIKRASTPSPVYTPAATAGHASAVKELYARPGNEIEINLMNNGWIFPGFAREQDTAGLSFLTRDTGEKQTRFLFKARQIGEYPLDFILQNNYTGDMQHEKYLVKVVPESQFYAVVNNPLPVQENSLEKADTLFSGKKYVQALTEYLKNYDETSNYLNNRIAEIYELLGDYETAAKYWERNREASSPYKEEAVSGIIRSAMKRDDLNAVLKYLDSFKAVDNPSESQDSIEVAAYLENKGKLELAITLLDEFRQKASGNRSLDQLYYTLAALYEKDTIFRDFKKAREYYQRVCVEYPDSEFSGASAERIKYLNRHFFYLW